jgi:hypothetical protein
MEDTVAPFTNYYFPLLWWVGGVLLLGLVCLWPGCP